MIETLLNDGYIEDEIESNHYLFGALTKEVLQADRDWRPFIPEGEPQSRQRIETNNCTAFGTLNAQEGYMKRKYNLALNFSDRYLGICSGTNGKGNSPHYVAEVERKYAGFIPENVMGFGEEIKSVSDYYDGLVWGHKLLGVKNLMKWDIGHEWALNGNETNWQEALYDALLYSPVGIAVRAWSKDKDTYVRSGDNDNHWTTLVYAKKTRHSYQWWVADSYSPYYKVLESNYGFTRAKNYVIKPREDFGIEFYSRIGRGLLGAY